MAAKSSSRPGGSVSGDSVINTILYAADLGLFGPFLLEHVRDLAQHHNAKVVMVHAVEPFTPYANAVLCAHGAGFSAGDNADSDNEREVMTMIENHVLAALNDDVSDLGGEGDILRHVKVVQGKASDVILSEAQRCGADMIVVGSHSRPDDSHLSTSLGSVASKILQLATVPVFLVPTQSHRNRILVADTQTARAHHG